MHKFRAPLSPSPSTHLLLPSSSYAWLPLVVSLFLTHLLLEVSSPITFPSSPFHCHWSSRSKGLHWWRRSKAYKLYMELHQVAWATKAIVNWIDYEDIDMGFFLSLSHTHTQKLGFSPIQFAYWKLLIPIADESNQIYLEIFQFLVWDLEQYFTIFLLFMNFSLVSWLCIHFVREDINSIGLTCDTLYFVDCHGQSYNWFLCLGGGFSNSLDRWWGIEG